MITNYNDSFPSFLSHIQGLYTDPKLLKDFASAREALPRILLRTRDYGQTFSEKVQTLVLALTAHPDLDCKYLGVRLSFSEFYKTRKDKEKEKDNNKEGTTRG